MHNAYISNGPHFANFRAMPRERFAAVNQLVGGFCKHLVKLSLLLVANPVLAQEQVVIPSGRDIMLHQVFFVEEYDGLTLHVSFLWPDIAHVDLVAEIEITELDMEFLCNNFALPQITAQGAVAQRIVITFSDQPIEFGVANPDAIQVFESYLINNNMCEWEAF